YLDETILSQYDVDYQKAEAEKNRLDTETNEYVREREVLEANNKVKADKMVAICDQIEKLENSSLDSKKIAEVSSDFEQRLWEASSKRFNESAEYLDNMIGVILSGISKGAILLLWEEASIQSEKSAEQCIASAQIWAQGNKNAAYSLNNSANLFLVNARHAKCLAKVNEAEASHNRNIANKWKEIEEKNQQSVNPLNQAVQSFKQRKTKEGKSWDGAGCGFYSAADKLAKAIEAEVAGKPEVAQKYRAAAEQQVLSVEPYTQAAAAHAEGKTDKGHSWNMIGRGFYNAAEKLEKAIEAEVAGKPEVAQKWSEAAEQQACSGKYFINALKAYVVAEKLEEAINAKTADQPDTNHQYRKEASQQIRSIESYSQNASPYWQGIINISSISEQNEAWLFAETSSLAYAILLHTTGQLEFYSSSEFIVGRYNLNYARSYAKRITHAGNVWFAIGQRVYFSAEQLAKAIEAEEAAKGEIAQIHRDIAQIYCSAATQQIKYCGRAVIGYVEELTDVAPSQPNIDVVLDHAVKNLEKAIKAELAGNSLIVQKYSDVIKLYKDLVQCDSKVAQSLYWAAENLEQAIEAKANNKIDRAAFLSKAAEKYQQAAEKYKTAIVLRNRSSTGLFTGAGKLDQEGQQLDSEGQLFRKEADNLST
ncbi:MAG TPA: hypothetical protein VJK54_04785, partial [Chthoniobacterales bacterium]|nr:hypothetical protein [Chthoniobacterales bacterium]